MSHLGEYALHTVEAGRFALDGGAMFGIVPKPLWERRIPADDRNRIVMNMRCLLLEGPDRLVLVDCGIGRKFGAKEQDIFAIDHDYADLHSSLAAAGFAPGDVTDVILTHLHFDHCGGATRYENGRLGLTFKNARHHVQRAHWHWAQDPPSKEKGSFLRENLEPLASSDQLHFVDGDGALFPGIEVRTVDGHTCAQQTVFVRGDGETLVFVADLLPTTAHLAPAWTMAYDVRPLVTVEEKAGFLNNSVEGGWHAFFEHDPEVAVASFERTDRGICTTDHRTLDAL